jgi:hypothetical protein
MSDFKVIQQNKCVGKLKEVYVIIHVDQEGNEGIFAEAGFSMDLKRKVAPELSPYSKDLPFLEERIKQLNQEVGPEIGMTFKIKKFLAFDSFN